MFDTYTLREVGSLHIGDQFIDRNDFPHTITGFGSSALPPGLCCILTDLLPLGMVLDTVALVPVLDKP